MNDLFSRAKWIWPENSLYLVNCYAGFRYDFELKEPLPEAPLHLTADQSYRLWINGKYVCRGPVRGHQKNWFYDTVDAAPYLRKGYNFIAVEAFNPGISTFSYHFEDKAGFFCAASWADGTQILSSRDSWTMFRLIGYASEIARLSVQMNFQEDLDLNHDDRSWIFRETYTIPPQPKWVRKSETAWNALPYLHLRKRQIPMLDEHITSPKCSLKAGWGTESSTGKRARNISWDFAEEELPSVDWKDAPLWEKEGNSLCGTIPEGISGKFYAVTLDLGREWLPGTPVFDVSGGNSDTVVELHYYHHLPDGIARLQPPPGIGSLLALAARIRLNGPKVHHEFYQIMGVRFVTIVVRGEHDSLNLKLSWRCAVYPLSIRGAWDSSDDVLNGIWQISRHTQQVCSMDVFVDTPWREQSQWWGDARIQAKNTYWLSGDSRLLEQGLHLIAEQEGAPDGLLFANAPTTRSGPILPDFCLTWIATLYDLYFQTGRTDFLPEFLPYAESILQYFENMRGENGVIGYDERFLLFEDWGDLPKKPYPAFLNLWHCHVLTLWREVLSLCGKNTAEVDAKIESEKTLLRKLFYDPEQQLMMPVLDRDGKPQGIPIVHDQVLALMLDLVPEAKENMLAKRIVPCLKGTLREGLQPGAFWSTYLLDLAQKLDLRQDALNYIRTHWKHMIPTSTTWEVFDRGNYPGWSFSHAWSAHPLTHIPELLCGIVQLEPGWRKIRFAPLTTADVSHASIAIPVPTGLLKAGFRKEDDGFIGRLEIPQGMSAEIHTSAGIRMLTSGEWDFSL